MSAKASDAVNFHVVVTTARYRDTRWTPQVTKA